MEEDKKEKIQGKMGKSSLKEFIKNIEKGDSKTLSVVIISLLGILLAIMIFNASNSLITGNVVNFKITEIKKANKPAKIELITIETNCLECLDIKETSDYVKGTNVHVANEETISISSEKAQKLISDYNIEKLPTVLVFGEINRTKLRGFSGSNDALIYEGMSPPYVDALTKEIKGKVEIINVVDSSCEECISLKPVSNAFIQAGVTITSMKDVEYNSQEGKSLIEEYGMKEVPAMIISKEIDYYKGMKEQIAILNPTEKNGFYKIHATLPPFRDLTSDRVLGLVEMIYIDDNSCEECYDVELNKAIIQRIGLFINNEKKLDISSTQGKQLIDKYEIEKAPIILISPEANNYDFFEDIWEQVGTKEKDGWFVMRKPEVIGTHKILESGVVINPRRRN